MPRIRYAYLPTEQRNPRSARLDQLTPSQFLQLMHREDLRAVRAIQPQILQVARAIALIERALRSGGRLFFIGAGTSGRLGVLEAAECPPTFQTSPSLIQALMAGGPAAMFRSREGAEDNTAAARRLIRTRTRAGDVVVGIAASGVTPFVAGALAEANRLRAKTILVTCNPSARMAVDVRIAIPVGPEILTGSTRLKAGTATKLVLNMLTLGSMVQLGKTYSNLMVDVRPTSRKLRARAIGIVQQLTGCRPDAAARALAAAHSQTKIAVLMVRDGLTYRAAHRRLIAAQGSLRNA